MKRKLVNKKAIIIKLLLILIISNFGLSFAYWATNIQGSDNNSSSFVQIGAWDYEDVAVTVATFRSDYESVLALTTETVSISDKAAVEAALSAYGSLSEEAKAALASEEALLIELFTAITAYEHSIFVDFEGYAYDAGLTGTVNIDGRTWYGNGVYIANDPNYDVWMDTRSLALKTGAYFQSQDYFINGIDKITLYSGALHYDNGTSFAYKIEYELQSNPGVWLTVQEGGSDKIIDVISGTPLTYAEVMVNITEAVNIRFTPVIGNTSDYINLDNIRVYEHVVTGAFEATTFRMVYSGALALTTGTVEMSDKATVAAALSAYDLLSVEAQTDLASEKALLDSLFASIETQEAFVAATAAVVIAENSNVQSDLDDAQTLVSALPNGTEKTALQARIDDVQAIIYDIATFLSDHTSTLALTVGTVTSGDKAAIEAALADYIALSESARATLSVEKALLDSLLSEINSQIPTATLVQEFRTNHADVLALTVGTVQISDQVDIVLALDAYDSLTEDAQADLTTEKVLLDSLLREIRIQEATAAVVIAESSNVQSDLDNAQTLVSALPDGTEKTALQARIDDVQDTINTLAATALEVSTFRSDYESVLALTTETVSISDKAAVEAALSAYGSLSEEAKAALASEEALLIELFTAITAYEHSIFVDFEGYAYDAGLTGTVNIDGRTWYGNGVYIANDPNYDVWMDTRSLALKTGAYFQSQDYFINGIDKITLYSGALHYDNGTSFAYKIEYELQSNPGVWLTVQEGGSDKIIDVISGTPLTYAEVMVNITEAVNIRFTPVIGNTSDYINLDNIRVYEHVVTGAFEATTFRMVYSGALALTTGTVEMSDKATVAAALSAYDLLSVEAQTDLASEKALLDSLFASIETQEAFVAATAAVVIAENSNVQSDLDDAQTLVSALPNGTEKTALQARIDDVQAIIYDIATFLSDHTSTLALTVGTVTSGDKAAIEAALADYIALSESARATLSVEKALLDSLLSEINSQIPTATLVQEFRTNHADVLALTVGTVQISDQVDIVLALDAYDSLTEDAQADLTTEKVLLDSLLREIRIQEATAAVVIAESSNVQSDLDNAQTLVSALPDGTEKTALQARIDDVQDTINTLAAAYVDGLITSLPVSGEITLSDESLIVAARTAYESLTITQESLVMNKTLLLAAESELIALQEATAAVVIAESSNVQSDLDDAQTLVSALPNGTSKTVLQNRLSAIQDIIDVQTAVTIINNYYAANSVVVSRLSSNTIKQNAVIAKTNEILNGLNVHITITNSVYNSRTRSTYTIEIVKNDASVTVVVSVTFTR